RTVVCNSLIQNEMALPPRAPPTTGPTRPALVFRKAVGHFEPARRVLPARHNHGDGPMSVLRRSVATAMVALAIAGADASAQTVAHPKDFQWTVGGQGGLLLVETPDGETAELPMAGIQTVIRARRTALLLSVQQAFGDNEVGGGYTTATFDEAGVPTGSSVTPVTWDWARKYSAALVVFPIRGHIDPYLGVGAGILQVGGFGDDGIADELSSMGYGTLIGGLELSAGRFMVFGE